jgi:hypothetical protein
MRISALLAFVVAAAAWAAAGAVSSPRPVPCSEVIDHTRFPFRAGGYRLVLGTVSVPPRYLRQVVPTARRPWAYWRKAGIVVRAGSSPVTVTLPRAWRHRAAITWGDSGVVTSLRLTGCEPAPKVGHAYAGGFYLRSSSACLPLIFRAGRRTATVRFGLGTRCVSRAAAP